MMLTYTPCPAHAWLSVQKKHRIGPILEICAAAANGNTFGTLEFPNPLGVQGLVEPLIKASRILVLRV